MPVPAAVVPSDNFGLVAEPIAKFCKESRSLINNCHKPDKIGISKNVNAIKSLDCYIFLFVKFKLIIK